MKKQHKRALIIVAAILVLSAGMYWYLERKKPKPGKKGEEAADKVIATDSLGMPRATGGGIGASYGSSGSYGGSSGSGATYQETGSSNGIVGMTYEDAPTEVAQAVPGFFERRNKKKAGVRWPMPGYSTSPLDPINELLSGRSKKRPVREVVQTRTEEMAGNFARDRAQREFSTNLRAVEPCNGDFEECGIHRATFETNNRIEIN